MAKSKQLLTTKAFSEKAGVSPATVSSWLKKGKIKGQKEGNKWLIPESELKKCAAPKATPKAAVAKKKTGAKSTQPKPQAKPARKGAKKARSSGSAKTFSVEEFSDMTYLTAYGVEKWLKEGRLTGAVDASGNKCVDASNLENPLIKRLIR